MTILEKKEFHDNLSRLLSEYEEGHASELDLYMELVKIENKWTELTSEL